MSALLKAGLVKRKSGKRPLIAFGKVVYDAQATIENAINNYWKLKAVDGLRYQTNFRKRNLIRLLIF
jgi:hypothetical protein